MITIKHDDDGTQPPNSWWVHKFSRGRQRIVTRCSNGHIGSLDYHAIAADGTVKPSVVCQHNGCNFHEFIKLDDYPQHDDICPECDGSGEEAGDYFSDDGMAPCLRCVGSGRI